MFWQRVDASAQIGGSLRLYQFAIESIVADSLDAVGIASFMQSPTSDYDDDMVAPDAGVYESYSGGIIDILERGETLLTRTTSINSSSLD